MADIIEDRKITSIPSGIIEPTPQEKIEQQKEENILEVKKVDDLDLNEITETTQIFKKPMSEKPKKKKRVLSERQKAHLEKMRQRKAQKAKEKKLKKSMQTSIKKPPLIPKPAQKQQTMPTPAPRAQPAKNNFDFDNFIGNVDKMINVLNKWNGISYNKAQILQPQQIKKKVMPKPAPKPQPAPQPSTMDFINRSCYNNFRRPFE